MSTANSQIQRTKRIMGISPFNGYSFDENQANLQYQVMDKPYSVYMPKREKPKIHNFLTNLRNSEEYLKKQNYFQEKFLKELETGKREEGGYDEIGTMIVNRKRKLKPVFKRKRGSSLDPKSIKFAKIRSRSNPPEERNEEVKPGKDGCLEKSPERKIVKFQEKNEKINLKKNTKKRSKSTNGHRRNQSLPTKNTLHKRTKNFRIFNRRPSFNTYQEMRNRSLLKSETDLIKKDILNPRKQNIRRPSNNLRGLTDFKKLPFRSVILKQNTGNMTRKQFKLLKSMNYEKNTLLGYGQNVFNTDPRDYIEEMR